MYSLYYYDHDDGVNVLCIVHHMSTVCIFVCKKILHTVLWPHYGIHVLHVLLLLLLYTNGATTTMKASAAINAPITIMLHPPTQPPMLLAG